MRKFWMIFNADGYPPRHKHYSLESATTEAERLATKNPGFSFFVLEATRVATMPPAPIEWSECAVEEPDAGEEQDLPF